MLNKSKVFNAKLTISKLKEKYLTIPVPKDNKNYNNKSLPELPNCQDVLDQAVTSKAQVSSTLEEPVSLVTPNSNTSSKKEEPLFNGTNQLEVVDEWNSSTDADDVLKPFKENSASSSLTSISDHSLSNPPANKTLETDSLVLSELSNQFENICFLSSSSTEENGELPSALSIPTQPQLTSSKDNEKINSTISPSRSFISDDKRLIQTEADEKYVSDDNESYKSSFLSEIQSEHSVSSLNTYITNKNYTSHPDKNKEKSLSEDDIQGGTNTRKDNNMQYYEPEHSSSHRISNVHSTSISTASTCESVSKNPFHSKLETIKFANDKRVTNLQKSKVKTIKRSSKVLGNRKVTRNTSTFQDDSVDPKLTNTKHYRDLITKNNLVNLVDNEQNKFENCGLKNSNKIKNVNKQTRNRPGYKYNNPTTTTSKSIQNIGKHSISTSFKPSSKRPTLKSCALIRFAETSKLEKELLFRKCNTELNLLEDNNDFLCTGYTCEDIIRQLLQNQIQLTRQFIDSQHQMYLHCCQAVKMLSENSHR